MGQERILHSAVGAVDVGGRAVCGGGTEGVYKAALWAGEWGGGRGNPTRGSHSMTRSDFAKALTLRCVDKERQTRMPAFQPCAAGDVQKCNLRKTRAKARSTRESLPAIQFISSCRPHTAD